MIPAAFVILCAVRLSMSLTAESSVLNNAAKPWSTWDSLPGAPQLVLSDDASAPLPLPLTFLQETGWTISNNGYLYNSKVTIGIYGCDLRCVSASDGIYYKAITKLYDGVWRQVVVISYVTTRYSSSSVIIIVQAELWDDGGVVLRYNTIGSYTSPCSGFSPINGAFLLLAGVNVSFAPQQGFAYYYSGRSVRAAYCAACGAACGMCVCPVGRYCPSNATTSFPCPDRAFWNVRGNTALSDCQTVSSTMSTSPLASISGSYTAPSTNSISLTGVHSATISQTVSMLSTSHRESLTVTRNGTSTSQTLSESSSGGSPKSISRSESITVSKSHSDGISRSESITVSKSHSDSISRSESITVSKSHSDSISRSESITSSESHSDSISRSEPITSSESHSDSISRSESITVSKSHPESPSLTLAASASRGTISLTSATRTVRLSSSHGTTSSSLETTASTTGSLSSSGCDDVPWFIEVVQANSDNSTTVGQSNVGALSSPREVTVSYDWFVVNDTALVLRFASLSPWRIRGAHLLLGGEQLAVDVSDVDTGFRGNATVRLSSLPNSTLMAGGGYVWPGVRRTPYVDQTVVVELDLRCSAVLAGGAAFTVVVRRLPMPAVSATAQAVVSSSQALSAMSGSPASASTMARVSAAMSAASCAQAIDSSSVAQSSDKVKSLFPIQFYNSSSPNDDIVNSLLANYIFVAAFATAVVLIALCVSLAAHVTVREVLLHLRWPSVLFPAIVATLPSGVGTIGAFLTRAMTSALLPEDWAPCLIACATGAVMWLGFCVWVTVVCVRGSWLLEPQLKEEEVTFVDKLKRCDTSWFRDFLCIVFQSQWMWVPGSDRRTSAIPAAGEVDTHEAKAELDSEKALFDVFLSRNASVFAELRVTWFTSLDVWVTLVSSVANAIPLTSVRGCASVAATNVVLALILLVIAAAARPFGSRFATVQLLLMQIGAFVCACCVFAYIIIASELLLSVVSYAVLVVGVVSMSRTVVDLVLLLNVAVRLRLLVRTRRCEEAALEGHKQVELVEDSVVFVPHQENEDVGMQLYSWFDRDRESPALKFAVCDIDDDVRHLDDQFWDASGNFRSCATRSPTRGHERRMSAAAMFASSDNESSFFDGASQRTGLETSFSLDDFDIDELLNGIPIRKISKLSPSDAPPSNVPFTSAVDTSRVRTPTESFATRLSALIKRISSR